MARTWGNKLDDIANINMMIQSIAADPLPADPHAPVKVPKDQPGSSPWLPGKSPAPSRKLAQGPDYAADKLKYGKYDKILDPSGTQKIKPTLEQLREHKSKYQA